MRRIAVVVVLVLALAGCDRFDHGFGGDGTVDFEGGAAAAVPAGTGDGIVVVGTTPDGPSVLRFDADGNRVGDTTVLRGDFRFEHVEIANDPRGGYVVAASPGRRGRGFTVIRLDDEATVESITYHGGDIHVEDVAVGPDGTAVVVNGRSTHTAFVDPAGRARIVETRVRDFSVLQAVAVQPDGTTVIGGIATSSDAFSGDLLLVRYTDDGRVDPSFGWHGIVLHDLGGHDEVQDIAVAPDGRLVLSVHSSAAERMTQLWVVRVALDGRVEAALRAPTDAHAEGRTVHVRPDGRIVTAGSIGDGQTSDLLTAQWLADGRPDPAWGDGGLLRTDVGGYDQLIAGALLDDGRLLGAISGGLVRYQAP